MSLHKSKGLSAKFVIVASCVEGWIPTVTKDLIGENGTRELEEQRRLFYVALTRTRERLILSSFVSMPAALAYRMQINFSRRSGGRVFGLASRFFSELGPSAPLPAKG